MTAAKRHELVERLRSSGQYINAHRSRTFVIQFGGEAVRDANFAALIHDIALLNSLGIRLVLVHGTRPQIDQRLETAGVPARYREGLRLTDARAMDAVKEAAGAARLEIEALLSMGLPNSPMAGARIRVISGNFVTARPMGVRDGVDFGYTGDIRRVDGDAIRQQLDAGNVVLVSPVGFSPTGEAFNVRAESVATAIAVELHASKLLLLAESAGLAGEDGSLVRELTLAQANARLRDRNRRTDDEPDALGLYLQEGIRACRNRVARTHIIDRRVDGALLIELLTRDGIGSMITADAYDATRRASVDDVGGVLELIAPLEDEGLLVRRSREKLEIEIERFTVMERDGTIIGCAAAYPGTTDGMVELACLAVHRDYRSGERGDALLAAVQEDARNQGANTLFVLTTQTTHWFQERGFRESTIEALPIDRQATYNYMRNSKVLVKNL